MTELTNFDKFWQWCKQEKRTFPTLGKQSKITVWIENDDFKMLPQNKENTYSYSRDITKDAFTSHLKGEKVDGNQRYIAATAEQWFWFCILKAQFNFLNKYNKQRTVEEAISKAVVSRSFCKLLCI